MDVRPLAVLIAVAVCVGESERATGGSAQVLPGAEPLDEVNFSEHVAPIVFRSCLPCHRAGESAPFSLLTYEEVAKRGRQIVEATRTRYMPPWLPSPGHEEFVGNRRLADADLATLERWVAAGTPEGDPSRLPPVPPATQGWQLGEPDLVISVPEPFLVPAEGLDVFRSFVLPIPVDRVRFVEAVELRPDNKRVLHHAVMRIDRTPSSRELDAREPGPGFAGMEMGLSEMPDGQFLGWTPGKRPLRAAEGLAWTLTPGADMVVQTHALPTGKPEPLGFSVGLHFTEHPPVNTLMVVRLRNNDIDIPPGESAYVLEDSLALPSAVAVTRIYPHTHYRGKRIEAFADLPDGSRKTLLLIEDWDFNWQDEYQYRTPVQLPEGARITMRYTLDNSAENPRNPQVPPRRVLTGNSSFDEMATLTLQVLAESAGAAKELKKANFRQRVEKAPASWYARLDLGLVLAELGEFEEAATHLRAGLALEPNSFELHRALGAVLANRSELPEAIRSLERALELSPGNASVHGSLAALEGRLGHWDKVAAHHRAVLRQFPKDAESQRGLGSALVRLDRLSEAATVLEQAVTLDPRDYRSHYLLGTIAFRQGRLEEATRSFRTGLEIHPLAQAHSDLARVYTARGMREEARQQREEAQRLESQKPR